MYLLDAVAQRVPADAWNSESCCEGWTARHVAGHAAWLIRETGSLASGNGSIPEQPEIEVAGNDPAAAIRDSILHTCAALDSDGALHRVEKTPFGEMPIDQFLGIEWIDPMTHAWDIADAASIDHGIDPAFAAAAHKQMKPASDAIRGPGGFFGDIVDASADDPVSKFIAFTGRTSVRS